MTDSKPSCQDFVVAAIRKMRYKTKNLKPGTSSGFAINRLWKVASEMYSEDEFRKTVNELIVKNIIAASWSVFRSRTNSSWSTKEFVQTIPPDIPLIRKGYTWLRDLKGNWIESRSGMEQGDSIDEFVLHVVADGLPQNIKNLKGSKAQQIVAEMQTQV